MYHSWRISFFATLLNISIIMLMITGVYIFSDTVQWEVKKIVYKYFLNDKDPYSDIAIDEIIENAKSSYHRGDIEDGRAFYQRAFRFLSEQNLTSELLQARFEQANTEYSIGDFPRSFEIFNDLYIEIKDQPPSLENANIIIGHARASILLGKLAIANKQIERAVYQCSSINDTNCLAESFLAGAKLFIRSAKWEMANDYAAKAKVIVQDENDKYGLALISNVIARIYAHRNKTETAIEHVKSSIKVLKESEDKFSYAEAVCLHADLEAVNNKTTRAARLYRQCRNIYADLSGFVANKQEILTLISLAKILQRSDKLEEASEVLNEAVDISYTAQGSSNTASVQLQRGDVFMLDSKFLDARDAYETAYNLFALVEDEYGRGKASLSLGEISIIIGEQEQAREYLDQAMFYLEKVNALQELAVTLEKLASIERQVQNNTAAAELLYRAQRLYNTLNMKKDAQRVKEVAALASMASKGFR